ncbi:High-affinity branched-chain amino acid transport system permease protein LivH [Tepidimonas alkaliphilus]|uniref:High-affinity branched-chain amino acid transport system permease protein LivH n=1 Tax=Tepidimonas alkaliphilus TaxID=2588942 RepID=A0A554WA50_9BURK|nr:branched-chain amino acid ABC transporter permease [Tepidimonas alkaliphilus]TSE20467.1 High-affinity branched-chain amino acid transport system permease protein LivH [Tepidimonas alkaliphilus]
MEFAIVTLLNGLSYGLLLFMLSSGLTLIFSLMGVLNFAHASFYMLGAYLGYALTPVLGFWGALVAAPLAVGVAGALFERFCLRKVHSFGHVPELLVTFGLSYVMVELVQLIWGRTAVPFQPPPVLQGPAFTLVHHANDTLGLVWGRAPSEVCAQATCTPFPAMRAFMMGVSVGMLAALGLLVKRTRVGLVIQAALTHPQMVEALGHNVPRVFMLVFGAGCALAGMAGVIGGSAFVTEPAMAATLGPLLFAVVVIGGLGSLPGALVASLLIGMIQTWAVAVDQSMGSLLASLGAPLSPPLRDQGVLRLTLSQVAPVLPYALLVLILILRPKGLLGTREH